LRIGLDRFGASAPVAAIAEHLGFTPDAVVESVQRWRGRAEGHVNELRVLVFMAAAAALLPFLEYLTDDSFIHSIRQASCPGKAFPSTP